MSLYDDDWPEVSVADEVVATVELRSFSTSTIVRLLVVLGDFSGFSFKARV